MEILAVRADDVVTQLGENILYDGRTLVMICKQLLLILKDSIIDSDDVLVVEGARILLRNKPKSGKIDLCPSYGKGYGRTFSPEKQKDYLNSFDFLGICEYVDRGIVVKLRTLPENGERWVVV
jgi:hypothetical protein